MTTKTKNILIGTFVTVAVIGAIMYIKKRKEKEALAKAATKTAAATTTTT